MKALSAKNEMPTTYTARYKFSIIKKMKLNVKKTVDYDKVESSPTILSEKMMKLEKELVKNEFLTNGQLRKLFKVTTDRSVQKIIAELNKKYDGANKVTRGPKHCLLYRDKNLAYPETNYFDPSDKELLNNVLKLASIFDGSIPLKSILSASCLRGNDLDKILSTFNSVMDVQLKGHEAKLIADLYKAIDSKIVVSFLYPQLEALYIQKYENRIYVSPYFLGRYNNKWFLIGAVMNSPKKSQTRYPWSVFPLQRILKENCREEKRVAYETNKKYKEIDINRIKTYYRNVMGFYVPTEPDEPFKEDIEPLNVRLRISDNIVRFLEENPIHHSQEIDKEKLILELTVVENHSLYKKLLSFGNNVEVLEPECVRAEMHRRIADTLKLYE